MNTSPLYLSAIEYAYGDRRDIGELSGQLDPVLLGPDSGLSWYRASSREIWQLAAEAGVRTLKAAADEPPDLLVYVTENDRQGGGSLTSLVRALDLPDIGYLRISGHECGNVGPALQAAGQALASGEHRRVLILLADKVVDGDRGQADNLSVFSDGAAAGLLSVEPPSLDGAWFAVHGVVTVTDATADDASDADESGGRILATVALAAAGAEAVAGRTGRKVEDFDHLLFPNYRIVAQRFLCSALGAPPGRLLVGPAAEFGHCFSADVLVSLAHCAGTGGIRPGEHVLAFGDGPNSWSSLAVERLG